MRDGENSSEIGEKRARLRRFRIGWSDAPEMKDKDRFEKIIF
jgi:hypothetical protein